MIYSTNSLGDKTITHTSMPGRDVIKQELQTLQRDWDEFVASVSDNKISYETCLLQWTDFDDSVTQVHKWMKDMEAKVSATEMKPDLGDKKVAVQKAKVCL